MTPKITDLPVPYITAYCPIPCNHSAVLPLDALVRRVGPTLTTDRLRKRLRCTVCGHKGATITLPTSPGAHKPWEPVPYLSVVEWARQPLPTWK